MQQECESLRDFGSAERERKLPRVREPPRVRGSPGVRVAAGVPEMLSGRGSLPERVRVAEGQDSLRQGKRDRAEGRQCARRTRSGWAEGRQSEKVAEEPDRGTPVREGRGERERLPSRGELGKGCGELRRCGPRTEVAGRRPEECGRESRCMDCAEQNASPKNLSCVTQRLDMAAMYAVWQLRAQGQDNLQRSSEDKREETEPAAAKSSFAAGEGGRSVMDWTLTDSLELCARP